MCLSSMCLTVLYVPMRGAEHCRAWGTAFTNANSDPAKTKEHGLPNSFSQPLHQEFF